MDFLGNVLAVCIIGCIVFYAVSFVVIAITDEGPELPGFYDN